MYCRIWSLPIGYTHPKTSTKILDKSSPKNTLHFEAQETQELNPDKSPLCQLVLKLTDTHQAQSSTASKTPIRVNKIINEAKEDYLKHWTNQTSNQSRMNSYVILNRKLADYLLSVRDVKQRQILTKYRLSDHNLAVETGRHRKTWLPREQRIRGHCQAEKVEIEEHFLLHCKKYDILRQIYTKLQIYIPDFSDMEHKDKIVRSFCCPGSTICTEMS